MRDLLHGDLSLRAMSLVYTTMLAIVPLLAFSFSSGEGPRFSPRPRAAAAELPRAARTARRRSSRNRIIGFVDNVSGSALAQRQHRAAALLRAVDGAEGREQLQLRLARRPAAQLRAPLQRVLERHARRPADHERRDGLHRHAREHDGDDAGCERSASSATCSRAEPLHALRVGHRAASRFLYVFVPNTRVRIVPALYRRRVRRRAVGRQRQRRSRASSCP